MITNDELFTVIRPHLQRLTGLQLFIRARSNAVAPTGAYGVIDVLTSTQSYGAGIVKETYDPDTRQFETEVRPQVMFDIVVEFFRGDAVHYARQLLNFYRYQEAHWDLWRHGATCYGTSAVIDLTALQSNQYEQRARITLNMRGSYSKKYRTNTIEKIPVSVSNEDNETLQTDLVTLEIKR